MRNPPNFGAPARLALALGLILAPAPALARPGGWGGPGMGEPGWGEPGWGRPAAPSRSAATRDRSREGRIQVNRFVGDDPAALGHGAIAIASQAHGADYVPQGDRAPYEAAVIDQLVHAGYDTAPAKSGLAKSGQAQAAAGQLAELTVTRTVVEDAEARRKPVSGEAAVSVGNRGTAYALAVNVDLSKPLPPLVSTRLEARIRDGASGKVLWEGRADVTSREGADHWSEQDIAARLAAALFDGFPTASDGAGPHGAGAHGG